MATDTREAPGEAAGHVVPEQHARDIEGNLRGSGGVARDLPVEGEPDALIRAIDDEREAVPLVVQRSDATASEGLSLFLAGRSTHRPLGGLQRCSRASLRSYFS